MEGETDETVVKNGEFMKKDEVDEGSIVDEGVKKATTEANFSGLNAGASPEGVCVCVCGFRRIA